MSQADIPEQNVNLFTFTLMSSNFSLSFADILLRLKIWSAYDTRAPVYATA
jgi:hypothetical protein